MLQTGQKSRSSFLHGFSIHVQDRSPVTRVKISYIRQPSAITQVQRWEDRQDVCCQCTSYVIRISLEAEAMRVTGHGTEAMLSRLLREETTGRTSSRKIDSPKEEAKSVSKAKEKYPRSLAHDQHLIT